MQDALDENEAAAGGWERLTPVSAEAWLTGIGWVQQRLSLRKRGESRGQR